MTFKQRGSGFTLIELLVVIAIIAILAAILFPVFAQAREKARQATTISNLKQLGLAFIMYTQDNNEVFPIGWAYNPNGANTSWPVEIAPYLKSTGILECPDDAQAGQTSNQGFAMSFDVNGETYNQWPATTYTQVGPIGAIGYWDSAPTGQASLSDAEVTQPDSSILLCESWSSDMLKAWGAGQANWTDPYNPNDVIDGNTLCIPNPFTTPYKWPGGYHGGVSVHPSGSYPDLTPDPAAISNFAFCDGHVKALAPAETHPSGWTSNSGGNSTNMWDARRPVDGNANSPWY